MASPTSSPENNRISSRKKKMRKTWQTKEWKDAVKNFTHDKECYWCGSRERLTAHHPFINSYRDSTYLNLYLSGCIVLCNRCHFALHKGLVLCPVCKSHYMRLGSPMCYGCYLVEHPEIIEAKKKAKEAAKERRRVYEKNKRAAIKESIKLSMKKARDKRESGSK